MSAEVFTEAEFQQAPVVETQEFSPEQNDVPCENKLGFAAMCGSCPLVRLLGECPKLIRESAVAEANVTVDEAPSFAISLESDLFHVPIEYDSQAMDDAPSVEQIEQPIAAAAAPVEIIATPRDDAPPSEYEAPVVEREPLPMRSYRDLLFDDSVSVVIASPKIVKQEKAAPVQETIIETTESVEVLNVVRVPSESLVQSVVIAEVAAPTPVIEPEIVPIIFDIPEVDTIIPAEPTLTNDEALPLVPQIVFKDDNDNDDNEAPILGREPEAAIPERIVVSVEPPAPDNIPDGAIDKAIVVDEVVASIELIKPAASYVDDAPAQKAPEAPPVAEVEELPLHEETPVVSTEPQMAEVEVETLVSDEEEPLYSPVILDKVLERSSQEGDDTKTPLTPERLVQAMHTYRLLPLRYARALLGIFALHTVVSVDK